MPNIYLFIHLFIYSSTCLFIHLLVCLSILYKVLLKSIGGEGTISNINYYYYYYYYYYYFDNTMSIFSLHIAENLFLLI